MAARYNIYDKRVLPDNILIKKLQKAATIYKEYADKDILIVYDIGKNGPFSTYEFHAGVENFQHLAGVKSPQGAVWFFNKCLDDKNEIQKKDIVPKENIKTTSAKINVLPDAIDLKKAKAYKFGEKDLVTLNVKFEVALGNSSNIMGLDKRKGKKACLPIPVTVMNRSLYEFCTQASKISLIMTKDKGDAKYKDVFYEITKGILDKAEFDDEIWDLIDYQRDKTVNAVATTTTEVLTEAVEFRADSKKTEESDRVEGTDRAENFDGSDSDSTEDSGNTKNVAGVFDGTIDETITETIAEVAATIEISEE